MKLAIMQPYFVPYLGYFRLMAAADKFVIYDDVNFIKGGWINRNRILMQGRELLFSVPLSRASPNRPINEIMLSSKTNWRKKLLRTFTQAYQQAPEFSCVSPVITEIVNFESDNLAAYLLKSLCLIKSYLEIPTELVASSSTYGNRSLKGQERILDICRQEQASTYLNLSGGKKLYDPEVFKANGIMLRFLQPREIPYDQFGGPFHRSLSILDLLMFNPVEVIRSAFLAVDEEGFSNGKGELAPILANISQD